MWLYIRELLLDMVGGKPMFIDTSSPDVLHYGVKIAYDPINNPAASTLVGYLACTFVYHMSMLNTK